MSSSGEQQSIAIAIGCIAYLNERFLYEKGLFRSSASLTDVRLLHTKMMQGDVNKVRNETDPHVVTGLLQKTLKHVTCGICWCIRGHSGYGMFLSYPLLL